MVMREIAQWPYSLFLSEKAHRGVNGFTILRLPHTFDLGWHDTVTNRDAAEICSKTQYSYFCKESTHPRMSSNTRKRIPGNPWSSLRKIHRAQGSDGQPKTAEMEPVSLLQDASG